MKKRISVVLFAVLLLLTSGCSPKNTAVKSVPFDKDAESSSPENDSIAENERFSLSWDSTNMSVVLTDKKSNTKWGTSPIDGGEVQYDEFGMPIKRHPQVESALSVDYMDSASGTVNTVISYTGAVQDGRIRCAGADNGIRVEYYFDEAEFMIPVDYTLEEDSVKITVDPAGIEEGANKILSISLAPYFCSLANDDGSDYFMVPFGSGGLVYPKAVSQSGSLYSSAVYGRDLSEELWDDIATTEEVRMPVYGVKKGSSAVCAVIESAADSAAVEVRYGSTGTGYSAVYTKFNYRSSVSNTIKLFYSVSTENQVASDVHISEKMTVGFYPLSGDKADYNGMVEVYRNYLKGNGYLSGKANDTALHLQMIGGVMTQESFFGVPYKRLYATTTLKDALEIVKDIKETAGNGLSVSLKGFGKTGIDIGKIAGGYGIGSSLGGVSDLKSLSKYCNQENIPLYMDFDLINYKKSGGGVSRIFDSVKGVSGKTAYQYDFQIAALGRLDYTKYQLLQRSKLTGVADKAIKKAEKWQLTGVSFGSLSSTSYSDFSDKSDDSYCSKSGMSADVENIVKNLKKQNLKFCAEYANDYAAVNADAVIGAPIKSDESDIISEDIPFYQMVFKGYVPLNGESVNLEDDINKAILRSVEGGCGLTFTVVNSYDTALVKTGERVFFNSLYSDLKDNIVSASARLEKYYAAVNGAAVSEHEIMANGLRKTVFDNGTAVYVNYGTEAVKTDAGTVNPNDFLLEASRS